MDRRATADGGRQADDGLVVPQGQARLQDVGEGPAGITLHHALAAPVPPRREQADGADAFRRPIGGGARIEELERAEG